MAVSVGTNMINRVAIGGSASVGGVLQLTLAGPPDLANLDGTAIQWLRNSTAISGATRTRYTVQAADAGAALTAQIAYPGGPTITSNPISIPGQPANNATASVTETSRDKALYDAGLHRRRGHYAVTARAGAAAVTSGALDPALGLPAGAAIVGTEIQVTGNGTDMSAGYNITGYTLRLTGDNCDISNLYSDDTGGLAGLGDKVVIDSCDGATADNLRLNGGGDARACTGAGVRLIGFPTNLHMEGGNVEGFPKDHLVGSLGSGCVIRRNHVMATTTFPTAIPDMTAAPAVTGGPFANGDHVWSSVVGYRGLWRSLVDNNTAPLTDALSWALVLDDPHVDVGSFRQAEEGAAVPPIIEENWFGYKTLTASDGPMIGANDCLRNRNNLPGEEFGRVIIRRNVLKPARNLADTADQFCLTVENNSAANPEPQTVTGNWFITHRTDPGVVESGTIWGDNWQVQDTRLTPMDTPGGAVAADALPYNGAAVPLTGGTNAPAGAVIQARAVSVDDGGATTTAWSDVGISSGTTWAGALLVPLSTSWYRIEVRVKGSTGPASQMANRIGVGHIWAYFEQSNSARIFNPGYSQTPVPPVTDPDALQVFQVDRSSGVATRTLVSDATPISASVVAIANLLAITHPGEKFAIAAHVQTGTSPFEMIDDTDPDRVWAYEQNLHDLVTVDGAQVGAVFDTGWIAWSPKPDNEDRIIPILTGKLRDGTVLSPGATVSGAWGSYVLAHDLRELYDLAYTMIGYVGPHGRAETTSKADNEGAGDLDYMGMVDDWAAVLSENVNFPEFLPFVMETVGGLRGVDDGNGGWADESHHSATDPDGLPRLAVIQAMVALMTLGMASWPVPAFDSVYYEPGGAYADFWMNGRDITTLRDLRNGAGSSTHVRGWTLNNIPLTTEAQIVANAGGSGRAGVRITPQSGVLDYGSNIQFGRGRLPGFLNYPGDYQLGYQQDLPVVELGPVGALPMTMKTRSTEALSNLLPAPASFTTSSTGPAFQPGAYGSGVTLFQVKARGKIETLEDGLFLWGSTGSSGALKLNSSGTFLLREGGNIGLADADASVNIAAGAFYTFDLAINLGAADELAVPIAGGSPITVPAKTALFLIDGAQAISTAVTAAELDPGRIGGFLKDANSGGQIAGTFEYVAADRNRTEWFRAEGDAATVIAAHGPGGTGYMVGDDPT